MMNLSREIPSDYIEVTCEITGNFVVTCREVENEMDFTKYIDQGILVAQEFIKQHGQTAWDTVLWLTIASRLSVIAVIIPILICIWLLHVTSTKFWKKYEKNKYDGWELPAAICTGLKWVLVVPILIIMFDVWNWIGVFYPELYLAKQAMDKVLN